MRGKFWLVASMLVASAVAGPARAGGVFTFSTGNPDGRMAMASRPSSAGKIEIEAADDFVLTSPTNITSATFTGLLPTGGSNIADVRVEIYRVFPNDSSNPPSGNVPTRVNSPSDFEYTDRDSASHNLTFTSTTINSSFTALNSVLNGIHPIPNFQTGGEGPVTGQEVQFNVGFQTPFSLSAGHYFFVPQVQLSTGDFLWLSAPKPIVSPGTPFSPDLQTWIRNEDLQPDWLRVGTDIGGGQPRTDIQCGLHIERSNSAGAQQRVPVVSRFARSFRRHCCPEKPGKGMIRSQACIDCNGVAIDSLYGGHRIGRSIPVRF